MCMDCQRLIKAIDNYIRKVDDDLEDIFAKSGVPDNELATLSEAVSGCVVYKAATPSFISSFEIKTYSGLSMYLPASGTSLLDSHYKDEPWNKAVGLVK